MVGLVATNDDAPTPQTATCSINVSVLDVRTIGEIQGSVAATGNPLNSRSPFAPATGNGLGQTVATRGVVAQRTLAVTAAGVRNYGFFLQEPATATDGDPTTSDGVFVFMNTFRDLIGGYVPQVGDEIVITARVSEFFFMTQLSSASLVSLVRSGVDVATEVPPFEIDPPADQVEANRYWERREGMQGQVPEGSLVQGGRSVFPGTADAEIYFYRGDYAPLADRVDPYGRRIFRDPHPLDDLPVPVWDNGNGFRFLIGSLGVKAVADDERLLLTPADTNDVLTNEPAGGVYYGFNKYQVQVAQQPTFDDGADPSLNGAPEAADPGIAWTGSTYNVENLYDFRDDPFDGCDFVGNTGCTGVNPPFDYVPASAAEYDAQLTDLATQIIEDLKAPDLIMTQEGEDQDICTVAAGALTCGATDDRDGKPDTLQELALRIAALGGPVYDAASDRDGADDRGIVSGFLYRTDRVQLLPVLRHRSGPERRHRRRLRLRSARLQRGRPEPQGPQHRPARRRSAGRLDPRRQQRVHPTAAGRATSGSGVTASAPASGSTSGPCPTTSARPPTGASSSAPSRRPTWPPSSMPSRPTIRVPGSSSVATSTSSRGPTIRSRPVSRSARAGSSARPTSWPRSTSRASEPLGIPRRGDPGGRLLVRLPGSGPDPRHPVHQR